MLGYNRTITHTDISVLINIRPGAAGGEGKEEVKKATFPTLLTMIVDLALPLARFTLQISNLEIFLWYYFFPQINLRSKGALVK